MRIVFIKDIIDIESSVVIRFGDEGTLIDEVTSTIQLDTGDIVSGVNPGKFLPACEEDILDDLLTIENQ